MSTPFRTGLKRRLREGPALNGFCTLASTVTAEIMALQPVDCLTIDLQHGLVRDEQALAMLQVAQALGKPVLCRVAGNDAAQIGRALDAGFEGVICPGVDDAAAAEAFIRACLYPPLGARSYGAARAAALHGPDYPVRANAELVTFATVGSRAALEAIDAIVAVDGLDGVYLAAADLSLSLGGGASQDLDEPALADAIGCVRAAAAARGRLVGVHVASPQAARQAMRNGFNLVSLMTDLRIYARAIEDAVAAATPP